jgi:hypothetical protein
MQRADGRTTQFEGGKDRAGQRAAGVENHLALPSVSADPPSGEFARHFRDGGVRSSDQQNRGTLQPGVEEIGGNSHADKPHGPARRRCVTRGDEGNGNTRFDQKAAHRLPDAARPDNGDATIWSGFAHLLR